MSWWAGYVARVSEVRTHTNIDRKSFKEEIIWET